MFTLLILNRLTLVMTRVIISITRMTARHLKAEQEIKQRLLSVSQVVWPRSYSRFLFV